MVAANVGLHDDSYVQILAAPVLFAFLTYRERDGIFSKMAWNPLLGIPLLTLILIAYVLLPRIIKSLNERPTYDVIAMVCLVVAWMAIFVLCYGLKSFRAALYPLCCLFLTIPVPVTVVGEFTRGLERASAATSYVMLRMAGIPVYAQGTRMSLPGVEIEVAPECSGIHSCISLVLVGLLASRMFLRYGWSRMALVVSTVPFAVVKNALRITVIAALSAYVDRSFLYGRLHHYGGFVFAPIALVALLALLVVLQKADQRFRHRQGAF